MKTHVVRAAVQCKAGVPRPTTQLASWLREDRVDIDSRSAGEISALYAEVGSMRREAGQEAGTRRRRLEQ